tara:strand:+ start:787 stop:1203 length:417 start_codon:yes stop_codon:yes gene_type:complete
MERLFVQVKDGQLVGHPILESNMRISFPHVDLDNLPPEFAVFTRIPQPELNLFEKCVHEYISDNSGYTDSWTIVPMTDEEKQEVIRMYREECRPVDAPSWIFDEETYMYVPPVPYPDDYNHVPYRWNEDIIGWERVNI